MCLGSAKNPLELGVVAVVMVLVKVRGFDVAATKAVFADDTAEVSYIPTIKEVVVFFVIKILVVM